MSDTPRKDVPLAFDMTLRDHAAIAFTASLISDVTTLKHLKEEALRCSITQEEAAARVAYSFADALLKVRT